MVYYTSTAAMLPFLTQNLRKFEVFHSIFQRLHPQALGTRSRRTVERPFRIRGNKAVRLPNRNIPRARRCFDGGPSTLPTYGNRCQSS